MPWVFSVQFSQGGFGKRLTGIHRCRLTGVFQAGIINFGARKRNINALIGISLLRGNVTDCQIFLQYLSTDLGKEGEKGNRRKRDEHEEVAQ